MDIVNFRDTWAEKELTKVLFNITKDIINGYKNSLLRG
jgi:hypothetical protein